MSEKFSNYLNRYEKTLKELFFTRYSQDDMGQRRGIPPFIMNQVGNLSTSDVSIPESFGGRGAVPMEILSVLEAASYESLPLSLILGINGALFLEPVAKYGQEQLKKETFRSFINNKTLGGLMITEPDYGTDALSMQTNWEKTEQGYAVKGEKHWAGLSGWADYWLMTAREKKSDNALKRDIDFFVCDSRYPEQYVKAVENYRNLGLYMIPYARNRVDVEVPQHHRLVSSKSGIRLMQDLLHRSRMRFAGMGSGFIHRMLDEAVIHTKERYVSGKPLIAYDQVQKRLSDLQTDYTISSAFCRHSAIVSSIDNDLSSMDMEANIHKTVMSDMMQNASQSLLQLTGAKGYSLNHIAGRSVVDSRPFQIFEGSNDVIYLQIADQFLKHMNKIKNYNFYESLKKHNLTDKASERIKKMTEFTLDPGIIQRKKIVLGEILGRITAMQWTIELGDGGYDFKLITQAVDTLTERIMSLLGTYHSENFSLYQENDIQSGNSAWLNTL